MKLSHVLISPFARFLFCLPILLTAVLGAPLSADNSSQEISDDCTTPLCIYRSQRPLDLELSFSEILSLRTEITGMGNELSLAQEALLNDKPHRLLSTPTITEIENRLQTLYNKHAELAARFSRDYPPLAKLRKEIVRTRPGLIKLKQERLELLRNQLRSEDDTLEQYLLKAARVKESAEITPRTSTTTKLSTSAKTATSGITTKQTAIKNPDSKNRDRHQHLLRPGQSSPNQTPAQESLAEPYVVALACLVIPLGLLIAWWLWSKARVVISSGSATGGTRKGLTLTDPSLHPVIGIIPRIESHPKGSYPAEFAGQLNRTWQGVEKLVNSLKPKTEGNGIILAITGCIGDQGSSTVAANLATKLSTSSKKVLLVDLDLLEPSLWRYFGLDAKAPGLSEVLAGDVAVSKATITIKGSGLHILPAGNLMTTDLGSITLLRLLRNLTQLYDAILLDCPPRLTASTLRPLAEVASSAIIVCDPYTVSAIEVRSLRLRLRSLGIMVLGTIVNKAAQEDSDRFPNLAGHENGVAGSQSKAV
jgi:Mrp family chromosome partitioning ATPase